MIPKIPITEYVHVSTIKIKDINERSIRTLTSVNIRDILTSILKETSFLKIIDDMVLQLFVYTANLYVSTTQHVEI